MKTSEMWFLLLDPAEAFGMFVYWGFPGMYTSLLHLFDLLRGVCLSVCVFASVIAVPLWKPVIKGYYFVLVVSSLYTENQFSVINLEQNLIHVWSWSMSFIDLLFSSFFYFVLTFSYVIAVPLWKPVTNRCYRFSHVKLVHLETGFLLFGRTSIQIWSWSMSFFFFSKKRTELHSNINPHKSLEYQNKTEKPLRDVWLLH